MSELWAGINNGGAQRNSNPTSIATPLALLWAKELTGLSTTLSRKGVIQPTARRSNNLSIRDGVIVTVVGSPNPANQYASFGRHDLETGALLSSLQSPHLGPVYTAGEGDATDLIGGLISHFLDANNHVYTMHGGDESKNSVFNILTGEIPPDLGQAKTRYYKLVPNPLDATWVALHNVDASGFFLFSEADSTFAVTGNYGSANAGIQQPVIVGRGMTSRGNGWAGGYHLAYAIEGQTVYGLRPLKPTQGGIDQATVLVAYDILPGTTTPVSYKVKWTHNEPLVSYLGRQGAPRAMALGDGDNRVYFYGQPLAPYIYDPTVNVADWTQPTVLIGLNRATGAQEIKIPSGYKMGSESTNDAQRAAPQISVMGSRVVVFQPQQGLLRGHVMCFDIATPRLVWSYAWAASTFQRSVILGTSEMGEQAHQLVIAGDMAFVVEPRITSGILGLRVYRFPLATGGTPVKTDIALGIPAVNVGTIALRDVAAVDGRLVALIDYDYLHQALAVVQ